jgi:Flp pilus assembly protein TadD
VGPQLQGDIQRIAKDYAAAAKSYHEAYQLKPTAQLALLTYQMRNQAGDAGGALAALEKGAADNPDAAELHMVLGSHYLAAQQSAKAIREFERVKELQPDNLVAWNNLAWLYQQQGDARALEYALKAKELAPKRPEVLDTYGWIELQTGDPAKGLRAIHDAAVYGPHLASVQYHLAVAQEKNGKPDVARKTLARLLKSGKPFAEREEAQKLLSRLESGAE